MAKAKGTESEVVRISPLKFRTVPVTLIGTAPYTQARMWAGQTAKKGGKRAARDFGDDFVNAQHIAEDGWNGIPAAAIRKACIDVCRMVGFKMTHAKMSIFVEADGHDKVDGTPLVKLIAGKPEQSELAVRNATGVADIRVRPLWRKWSVKARVRFDEEQFTAEDVVNLINRAGEQVGIGEGRPFSKQSNGLGFGTFRIE